VAVKHLTDIEIQDYLDDSISAQIKKNNDHLENCEICRNRLEQYRILYGELKADSVPELSPNFVSAVMTEIKALGSAEPVRETSRRTFRIPSSVFAILGSIAAVIAIIYFVDFKPLLNSLRITGLYDYINGVLLSRLGETAGLSNFDFTLAGMTILTLIIIGAIDLIIRHYRHRTALFMA